MSGESHHQYQSPHAEDSWPDEEPSEGSALVEEVQGLAGRGCVECGRRLCGHQVVFNVVLGFKTTLRCLACNARCLDRPALELRDHLFQYVLHRDCYRQAWESATGCASNPHDRRPSCLWSAGEGDGPTQPAAPQRQSETDTPVGAERWDAGDMGCGDLVLALRLRLQKLEPGGVLKVTARDPAAPEDLPAWCRLTGHRLVWASHPEYLIERKRGS